MRNAIFTLAIFVTALLAAYPGQAQVSFGEATKFNDGWLFRLTDDSTIVNPAFNDSEWRKLRCRTTGPLKDNCHPHWPAVQATYRVE